MEVVDANSDGVQKSSTAVAESVQEEVSDDGTTTTTTTITKTTKQPNDSKLSENDDIKNDTSTETAAAAATTTTTTIKKKVTIKKDDDVPIKKEVKINDEIVKIEDVPNDDNSETEIIEIIEGDESGEEVEIVETVVIKKINKSDNPDDKDNNGTTTTTTETIQKKIINKQNSNDDSSTSNNNDNTEVTIKLNKPKIESLDGKKIDEIPSTIDTKELKKEEESPKREDNKEEKKIVVNENINEDKPKVEDKQIIKEEEVAEEEEEEEEIVEEEEVEEEEEEEEEQIKEIPIKEKTFLAQKPPLPTSVTTNQNQQLQEDKEELTPIVQHQQQQHQHQQQQQQQQQQYQDYQMQQQQVGQHEKQHKNYIDKTIFYGCSPPSLTEIKQENIKNQLKEIISDIDRVIEQEEDKTPSFQHRNYQQQQQQQQPQQHQVSTTRTREESHDDGYLRKTERIERNEIQDREDGSTQMHSTTTSTSVKSTPQSYAIPSTIGENQYHYGAPPPSSIIKSYDQMKGHRSMSLPSPYVVEQSSSSSTTKTVDLQKIFTPASDYDQIIPKNRKLYSSSAFYSPNLHPTVEDQVELARRISHSLSDISNQQSKGQSMYVNRKKRSVKWVHEGEGKAQVQDYNTGYHGYERHKENEYEHSTGYHDKLPLKLVMNPRGQVRDFTSVRQEYNHDSSSGLLSPDKCAELVAGLNAPKGRGAELFAKRRKKSEKWIVDETNAAQQSPSGVQPYGTISPNILPAYSDLGVQRVQLNMHQDQIQDKYAQPRIKMIKTPWDAALETGSASAAFQELPNLKQPNNFLPQQSTGYDYSNYTPVTYQMEQNQQQQQQQPNYDYQQYSKTQQHQQQHKSWQPNSQRDLAYKPNIPQGWNAPPTNLPKDLFVPKEIPLDGYIPPSTDKYLPANQSAYSSAPLTSSSLYNSNQQQQQYNQKLTDYSTTYQQSSSTLTGNNNDYSIGYNSGINLSTSPIPQKTFPITQQYSSTLLNDINDNYMLKTKQQQQQRSVSPYQTTNINTVATTAAQFNNKPSTGTQHFPIKTSQYYSAPPINKPMNNWKTQLNVTNQAVPVNFNPSPLPYEKLAKFQQPDPNDNDYGFRVPIPGIKRPLNVPKLSGKIRNLSPLPYYSTSPPSLSSSSYTQQQQSTSTTTTHYETLHDKQQQQYNINNNQYDNYGGGGGGGNVSVGVNNDLIGSNKLIDLSNCHNYNTTARGWGQSKTCYKPTTFMKTPIATDMPYTDF